MGGIVIPGACCAKVTTSGNLEEGLEPLTKIGSAVRDSKT